MKLFITICIMVLLSGCAFRYKEPALRITSYNGDSNTTTTLVVHRQDVYGERGTTATLVLDGIQTRVDYKESHEKQTMDNIAVGALSFLGGLALPF